MIMKKQDKNRGTGLEQCFYFDLVEVQSVVVDVLIEAVVEALVDAWLRMML